jgi:hypothetical protein
MKSVMRYRATKAAFLGICLLLLMAFGFVRSVVIGGAKPGQNTNSKAKNKDKAKDKAKVVPSEPPRSGDPGKPPPSPKP